MYSHNKMNMFAIVLSVLFFNNADGISVKWGTNDGPIVPPSPTPPPTLPPKPYRVPAPVWEDLSDDIPNPNPYRPSVPDNIYFRHIKPVPTVGTTVQTGTHQPVTHNQQPHHTRYTNVQYKPISTIQPSTTTLTAAKAFVNAYRPTSTTPSPSTTQRTIEITPRNDQYNNQNNRQDSKNYQPTIEDSLNGRYNTYNVVPQLGLRYNPGFGFKYVAEDKDPRKYAYSKQYNDYNSRNDDKYNAIETNDIYGNDLHKNDLDLSYEKHLAQRIKKSLNQQFYVPQQQPIQYFSPPQLFYPANFVRH